MLLLSAIFFFFNMKGGSSRAKNKRKQKSPLSLLLEMCALKGLQNREARTRILKCINASMCQFEPLMEVVEAFTDCFAMVVILLHGENTHENQLISVALENSPLHLRTRTQSHLER